MSLQYVLGQVGVKMGLNPSDPNDRSVLLRFANEAAIELYAISDMAGCLMEQVFKVNGDQTIALPSYVGQIRAIREYDTFIPWHINQMRPRYNQSNWPDMWRNFRLKGLQPLITTIRNESVLTAIVPNVEDPPITVSISGATNTATNISEDLVMSSTRVATVNNFISVNSIKKNDVNTVDVQILDVDGNVLSVIPNDMKQAQYQIIDVSMGPWLNQTEGKLDHYLEILYKKSLPWFKNDDDEFPALGYDNVWVNKILQLWAEEQGKTDMAVAYGTKAQMLLANIHEDANRATEDVISLCENPHDMLNPRERARRPARYGGYMTNRYGYM
jgi:hypothetical protein